MLHVITVCAAVENLMLFNLYKIFVGRNCRAPTNDSHESPLKRLNNVSELLRRLAVLIGVREGILLGGRKKFAMKITIFALKINNFP